MDVGGTLGEGGLMPRVTFPERAVTENQGQTQRVIVTSEWLVPGHADAIKMKEQGVVSSGSPLRPDVTVERKVWLKDTNLPREDFLIVVSKAQGEKENWKVFHEALKIS